MADAQPTAKQVQDEIAREIERVHVESYGAGASNIDVQVSENLVVVIIDVELAKNEQTLVHAGREESVQNTREAFQQAIAPTFTAIIERATGRRVNSFASRMIMEPPWSVELFRLEPAG
ncbi:MAG TPA: Na-translocating system protein MpsC family protein [Solirubrobacterales bacterium]|nr:Na-translocating system protein MpsC family protein [Solirubrobacterales bacterium]